MKTSMTAVMLLLAWMGLVFAGEGAPGPAPAKLRCEYRENPLGIDVVKPRLSWIMEDGRKPEVRGQKQTAYQVLVASTPERLAEDKGDLWDSGTVASDQSVLVEYLGRPLESRLQCHWKVRVW